MKQNICTIPNDSQKYSQLRQTRYLIIVCIALLMSVPAIADTNDFVANARLPTDFKATCTADIDSWFALGHPSANGLVIPANSLDPVFANFNSNTLCDFYKWGAQMFLFLTSPGDYQHIFNTTPLFYSVSVKSKKEREFVTENGPMLMTVRKGKIEVGQAGDNYALLSQNEALVYYGIHANDVYALFTTQSKMMPSSNMEFPNTLAQLNAVSQFAFDYGYPLQEWADRTLTMELKTAWVDADSVADRSRYILGQAIVPVFYRNEEPWKLKDNVEITVALVGMHVVGTVNKHPEMVWSTFEHVDNVPNNDYLYHPSTGSTPKTLAYDSSGKNWTFLPEGAAKPMSIDAKAMVKTDQDGSSAIEIHKTDHFEIGPSNVLRVNPWGNPHGSGSDGTAVDSNTNLVSLNVSVLSQLAPDDVRGNYIQTGGIWTSDGTIPTMGTDDKLRGSLNLANTTMETFFQNPTPHKNCFACHGSSVATHISHVYVPLQSLPPPN
jgi:hypothetical protein